MTVFEKYFPYIIVGGLGLGVLYLLSQKPATAGAEGVTPATPKYSLEDRLLSIASRQLGIPTSELVVRSLIPSDIGTTTYNFPLNAGWNTIANTAVADNRFIALTGVTYGGATPVATEIRIQAGGRVAEYWNIQNLPLLQTPTFTDTSPTIVQQNQLLLIQVYATGASASENINFSGIVVERRGMTIG